MGAGRTVEKRYPHIVAAFEERRGAAVADLSSFRSASAAEDSAGGSVNETPA